VLIDARHGIKPADDAILDTLGQAAVSHQLVLTKCDEVSDAELTSRIAALTAALKKRPAAFPQVLATSARTAAGIGELRAAITRLMSERDRSGERGRRDR
jgi:GTP-binding protein